MIQKSSLAKFDDQFLKKHFKIPKKAELKEEKS
jgi:hypothetical protein